MNKALCLILVLLLFTGFSCINITIPEEGTDENASNNSAPVAYIDSVEPSSAITGQSIVFKGRGTDTDGFIVGYEWQSNIDGVLSTVESFSTTSLSTGTHTISFRVIDDSQRWSPTVKTEITVQSSPGKPPVILSFKASAQNIDAGSSSKLQWSVTGADSIAIDNGIGQVPASGSINVYPFEDTIFTLAASNQDGTVTSTTDITVRQSTVTGNPVIDFTAQYMGGNSWQLTWNVENATEITIEPDIGPVDSAGSTVVTVPSGHTVTYTLKAINNWGWAYWQVILSQP